MTFSFRLKKTQIVPVLFWMTIVFQLTVFKYIWGVEGISKATNIILLIVLSIVGITSLSIGKFDKRLWMFYIIPGFLIFFGMMLNISINVVQNPSLASYFGLVLPWATFIAVPFFMKAGMINIESLWRQYYYFMIVAIFLMENVK